MKISRTLFLLLLFCFAAPANALVLRGLVSEVPDGRTVVVISNGRKLTVLLKGVEAPDLRQDFGDVSRQYLASLILDKAVEIDLSQLKAGEVMGKVIYDQIDIGLQVIRDGAAWYDRKNDRNLTEAERNVYAAAEEAARGERRGLWQDGSRMPPWEWRRAEAAKFVPKVATKAARKRGLQTEDLLFTGRRPIAKAGSKGRGPLAKPTQKPFNTPGQDVDFSSYLTQGLVTFVYFYADWCPACRELSPVMEQINARSTDTQVVFMNIGDWNTPVARQYGITFVPYLKIYDKSGNLVAEGKNAITWLQRGGR